MEWSILFAGPVGAGKTEAVRTASDIEVVSTEAAATDATALLKPNTTVAMDIGLMHLEGGHRVRLLGAPGQERFDFMWEILLEQARGLVLLVDHSRAEAPETLRYYVEQIAARPQGRWVPWVVGVTHVDLARDADLSPYRQLIANWPLPAGLGPVPVLQVDARSRRDVRGLLLALTSMLEITARLPLRQAQVAAAP